MQKISNKTLLKLLKKEVESRGALTKWSEHHGLSKQFVSNIMAGLSRPTERIAKALGYKKIDDDDVQKWVKIKRKQDN